MPALDNPNLENSAQIVVRGIRRRASRDSDAAARRWFTETANGWMRTAADRGAVAAVLGRIYELIETDEPV